MKTDVLIYDDMLRGGSDGVVYFNQEEGNYYNNDPFFTGRLAMRLDSSYFVNRIDNAKSYSQNSENIIENWDIVTAPVGSQNPDVSYYASYSELFAINATLQISMMHGISFHT